jgi:hypothetical protein
MHVESDDPGWAGGGVPSSHNGFLPAALLRRTVGVYRRQALSQAWGRGSP